MNKMKNVVVLKNLPSNIIDEAIVILKQNKKIPVYESNKKEIKGENETVDTVESKEYIIKEAQLVLQNYISEEIQDNKRIIFLQKKYTKLKKMTISLVVLAVVGIIIGVLL